MAEPKQLSLDLQPYLTRWFVPFQNPGWMQAERWRTVVHNQPVAGLCQGNLIRDLQGTQFEIRAKETKDEDKLADDITHYTQVVNPDFLGGLSGFDIWVDYVVKDILSLPIGGNTEVVRYPDGFGPLSRDYSDPKALTSPKADRGHVAWLAYIDGASLSITYDRDWPIMQTIPESPTERVFFQRDQIARTVLDARSEMRRWGYGMAPPERIYLAIEMLARSDAYYAKLLIDTPEAGLLDMGGMAAQSAKEWLNGFRELLTGIDPFKIPVIYDNPHPAKYIPFNRPPTEIMLDTQTLKYAQITAAAYGLTLTDINLGDPQKTLAGSIRDERRSRRSGYGTIKEKIKNLINNEILPDYLIFEWVESDEETKNLKGKSFLTAVTAIEKAHKIGAMNTKEAQAQLVKDGHITVEVEEPEEVEPMTLPLLPPGASPDDQAKQEADKVPASEGGRGDVTATKAALSVGDPSITAAPSDAPSFDQMAAIFRQQFSELSNRANRPRLMKLVKAATRRMFPQVEQAFTALSQTEVEHYWLGERLKSWFGETDSLPDVQKATDEVLEALEQILDNDAWWSIAPDGQAIILTLKQAFEQGATLAAQEIQEFLYTEGLRDSPQLIGLSFSLKNPRTLAELETKAAQLVRRVNDGTKFYLKRIITAGVDEGLASANIAQKIRDGASASAILKEAGFVDGVIERALTEISAMSEGRVTSIVNTEINRAESLGRLRQWSEMGLSKKGWRTFGDACHLCKANEADGFVAMDYVYRDTFGGTLSPPGHPQVCRCHLIFDEQELIGKADTLEVWTGE